jgi:hypothetical protein
MAKTLPSWSLTAGSRQPERPHSGSDGVRSENSRRPYTLAKRVNKFDADAEPNSNPVSARMQILKITRRSGKVYAYAAVPMVLTAVVFGRIVGCGSTANDKTSGTTSSSAGATASFAPPPPSINAPTLTSGPVTQLQPGSPIMVGDRAATMVCKAGFYVDYPDSSHAGQRPPGFITSAQCSQGAAHAAVSVMKVVAAGQPPARIKVGDITYVATGDEQPAVANEPWTIPTSPLAVFSSGRSDWALPVDLKINDQTPTAATVQAVQPVEQRKAPAKWSNVDGVVVTGHVLDPVSTPELADLPVGIAGVVVAADDTNNPIERWVLGSPATVDLDDAIYNLGVITGVDETRHWIVVDLINPLLAQQNARLITTA